MFSLYRKNKLITTAAALLLLSSVGATFLGEPSPKWSIQLKDSGKQSGRGLRQGNAIVSHKDGTKIIVTANDGSLHIIQTTNQVKTLGVFEPEPRARRTTECFSAPVVVYAGDQDGLFAVDSEEEEEFNPPRTEDFILYAVIDKAGDSLSQITSRLVAVDMEGSLKWTLDFEGKIEGTPVVGKSGIFVTTNEEALAMVSVLQFSPQDGSVFVASTAGAYDVQLGPPALRQPAAEQGNKNNDDDDDDDLEDIVVVAENWEAGFSITQGGLYMFPTELDASPEVEIEGELTVEAEITGKFQYKLTKISSWSYGAVAPPLVSGDSIFLGAAGGTIGGFTGNRKNDLSGITSGKEDEIEPQWDFRMQPNPVNASQPVQSQPVLSPEGNALCVGGVNNDFYCVSTDDGRQIWRNEEASDFLAKPVIYRGRRTAVYAIETENGRVHLYDLFSGRRFWDYSCTDVTNNLCQDPVEADFAVTPGGNTLFYGDIYGRINCLGVGNFETETPTIAPTGTPTATPTGVPTVTATPTKTPTEALVVDNSDLGLVGNIERDQGTIIIGDNDGGASGSVASAAANAPPSWFANNRNTVYIGAAIAALCFIMIPILLFSMLKKKKKKLLAQKSVVVEMVDDCSSEDLEAQAQEFFDQIETNNTYDPNNGDGIEIEIINKYTPPTKHKRNRGTPATVNNSLEDMDEIDEIVENSSAIVVLGKQYSVLKESVEAVNLRQTFDQFSDKNTDDGSLEDVPPPPPVDEEKLQKAPESPSMRWVLGSLAKMSPTKSPSKKADASSKINSAEKLELKQPDLSSREESSVAMSSVSQKESSVDDKSIDKKSKRRNLGWRKKNKKVPGPSEPTPEPEPEKDSAESEQAEAPVVVEDVKESEAPAVEESNDETATEPVAAEKDEEEVVEEEVTEDEQAVVKEDVEEEETEDPNNETQSSAELLEAPVTPRSPSMYSMISDAVQSITPSKSDVSSPVKSVQSIQESLFGSPHHSSTKSAQSDDDSLYTSYTGFTGMFGSTPETKKAEDMSPYSKYVYSQEVRRRDRDEIAKEGKSFLSQPALDDAEHPDDEMTAGPGDEYLKNGTMNHRRGTSARADRFLSKNNESGPKTIAQMYDQLAAIGQQRREERKPAFRRRNKKHEQEKAAPASKPAEREGGDTWGSFLNELAEAEKQFFSPSESKSKVLLDKSKIEDIGELPRI